MKPLFTLIIFLPVLGFAQKSTLYALGDNVLGRPKMVTEVQYAAEGDSGHVVVGDMQMKIVYKYDSSGYVSETDTYDNKSKLLSKTVNITDKSGQLEKKIYGADGSVASKIVSQTDSAGNVTGEMYFKGDGDLNEVIKYKYDKDGNKTEQSTFNGDGALQFKDRFTYNKDNLIDSTYLPDGKLNGTNIKRIDGRGSVTADENYDASGNMLSIMFYQYSYDRKQNWVTRTKLSSDNDVKETETRKIVYYQ